MSSIPTTPRPRLPPLIALLLITVTTASAWYDPGMQRWITRDPTDDWGSIVDYVQDVHESDTDPNLYRFVANAPSVHLDHFGLKWHAGGKWDGKDDGIVCDGK